MKASSRAKPGLLAIVLTVLLSSTTGTSTAATLPPLPSGWPATLHLGMASFPDEAASLRAMAPFGFRYQYLAGGVNTGNGWATWNPNGSFVDLYMAESAQQGMIPVFSYYMIQQSLPGGGCESQTNYNNLQNTVTMTALFNDMKLFFQRAALVNTRAVLHVEPDLWGFMQQRSPHDDPAEVSAKVAATGIPELAGLPNNMIGVARAVRVLRDHYAPNVWLAYHLSEWGTNVSITIQDPADSEIDVLAQRAAKYFLLQGDQWDIVFAEFSDRDAAFHQIVNGDGGVQWWTTADQVRNLRFISGFVSLAQKRVVEWQIPLGNTKMRAMNNTWNHYQDNRVEMFLDQPGRTRLQSYADAGVVAFLFGRGAYGATCACDGKPSDSGSPDGITNPAPINGNTLMSLSADDDGGFFRQKAAAYYTQGAIPLPTGRPTLPVRGSGPGIPGPVAPHPDRRVGPVGAPVVLPYSIPSSR
ncbi:MAG: hypothetical protein U0821_26310 [Chloroflexota bacterium]